MFSQGLVGYMISTYHLEGTAAYLVWGVGVLLSVAAAYLLGSINFAILISKVVYKDDIRKYGSGNAGATNMLRTYGKGAAAGAFIGDLMKTVIAVLFGSLTLGYFFDGGSIAGFFCVLGHIFPIFSRFQGGKGVSAAAAVAIMMNLNSLDGLMLIGILLFCFVVIVAGTKYVSLGSVITFMAYPILQSKINGVFYFTDASGETFSRNRATLVLFAFLTAVVIFVRHIGNLKRIREGKESKISFKKTSKKPVDDTSDT